MFVKALPIFLLVIGATAGLIISKITWNYYIEPPSIQIECEVRPIALSMYQFKPGINKISVYRVDIDLRHKLEQRNDNLWNKYNELWNKYNDNNLGSFYALFKTNEEKWFLVEQLSEYEVSIVLQNALQALPTIFFTEVSGVIGMFRSCDETKTLVSFDTMREIENDRYAYGEVLLSGATPKLSVLKSIYYFYDVAGIEFAQPPFWVFLGIIITYAIAGLFYSMVVFIRLCCCCAYRKPDQR